MAQWHDRSILVATERARLGLFPIVDIFTLQRAN